jgi:hypothetical protein
MQAREVTLNTSDVDVSVFADANGWRGMFSQPVVQPVHPTNPPRYTPKATHMAYPNSVGRL